MQIVNDTYKTINGINLPIRIYYPDNHNGDCVVNIHGGGWHAVSDNSDWNGGWMNYQAEYYAKKGYIGIVFSYRSIDLTEKTEVSDIYCDCKDAMKYINDTIKYNKMIVTGDSAGGHLATLLGLDKDVKTDIIVACNPVLDLTEEKWAYCARSPEVLKQYSPYFNITKTDTKFLLMHGNSDTVVDYNITKSFYDLLKQNNIYAHLVILPKVRHAFILKNYKSTDEQIQGYMDIIDKFITEN